MPFHVIVVTYCRELGVFLKHLVTYKCEMTVIDQAIDEYEKLHDFSVQRPADFWASLWIFLNIKASVQPSQMS